MYIKVKPLVEKMKAKYPFNMEGLEPALTNDIAEIVLEINKAKSFDDSLRNTFEGAKECGHNAIESNMCKPYCRVCEKPTEYNLASIEEKPTKICQK